MLLDIKRIMQIPPSGRFVSVVGRVGNRNRVLRTDIGAHELRREAPSTLGVQKPHKTGGRGPDLDLHKLQPVAALLAAQCFTKVEPPCSPALGELSSDQ